MLHEALMLEIYRQALNAGAMPTIRPRSTESANSSERCPSNDSNISDGRDGKDGTISNPDGNVNNSILPIPSLPNSTTFSNIPQNQTIQAPSMEAYLHMVAAAAQQCGFQMTSNNSNLNNNNSNNANTPTTTRLPLILATDNSGGIPFKLPNDVTAAMPSTRESEALDFRTNIFAQVALAAPTISEDDDFDDDGSSDANNPLDLSISTRKRSAELNSESDSSVSKLQVKKIFKSDSSTLGTPIPPVPPLLPSVNPYLAAVAAANIFRTGQFPDWNSKSDLVVDPLEKMSDIVKAPRKEKNVRSTANALASVVSTANSVLPPTSNAATASSLPPAGGGSGGGVGGGGGGGGSGGGSSGGSGISEGSTKARHNIWQSHWQNKGVANSVFRCVWCKYSFPTLDALTTHMKDSKNCGVNVPPFNNFPNTERLHQSSTQTNTSQHSHNLRKQSTGGNTNTSSNLTNKNTFQFRNDPATPLPRKLVRGQNVWLGKGVEQAMQILKCMRCGESFRSLGEMTKHMQETQHYTNILSQEQTVSMKTSSSIDTKEGHNNLSSEESRTLSAVLTCKVCDKAFNSLGDLSTHMAKNNHYTEPLMQSMSGVGGGKKTRQAPKKREKSLPVRKLLEIKGIQNEVDGVEAKMQRSHENAKRLTLENTNLTPVNEKSEVALFAERMRQYISNVKTTTEEAAAAAAAKLTISELHNKSKLQESDSKNGTIKANVGSSSVLSAIEQMFTTSFETPPRQTNQPASSPSHTSVKNTSPVSSNILKRLGIDESVDYNKPLMDASDPYFSHYRYTSSERSGSECSTETYSETHNKPDLNTTETEPEKDIKDDSLINNLTEPVKIAMTMKAALAASTDKAEEKSDVIVEKEFGKENTEEATTTTSFIAKMPKSATNDKNSSNCSETNITTLKIESTLSPYSPPESQRSTTPKSPASSIKSYENEKKYPSDSLNALSSMFDSLGNPTINSPPCTRSQSSSATLENKVSSTESSINNNNSNANSMPTLRQFCVKREKNS